MEQKTDGWDIKCNICHKKIEISDDEIFYGQINRKNADTLAIKLGVCEKCAQTLRDLVKKESQKSRKSQNKQEKKGMKKNGKN